LFFGFAKHSFFLDPPEREHSLSNSSSTSNGAKDQTEPIAKVPPGSPNTVHHVSSKSIGRSSLIRSSASFLGSLSPQHSKQKAQGKRPKSPYVSSSNPEDIKAKFEKVSQDFCGFFTVIHHYVTAAKEFITCSGMLYDTIGRLYGQGNSKDYANDDSLICSLVCTFFAALPSTSDQYKAVSGLENELFAAILTYDKMFKKVEKEKSDSLTADFLEQRFDNLDSLTIAVSS
jgi:hypothetical protein